MEVSADWEVIEFIEIYDSRFPTCQPVAPIDMEATCNMYSFMPLRIIHNIYIYIVYMYIYICTYYRFKANYNLQMVLKGFITDLHGRVVLKQQSYPIAMLPILFRSRSVDRIMKDHLNDPCRSCKFPHFYDSTNFC